MARTKKQKMKLSIGERMLYSLAFLCVIGIFITKTFLGANVGHLKVNVEKMKQEILNQEKKVECLTMKVNELTSFDKVQNIVKDMGLAYHNDNIIVVD